MVFSFTKAYGPYARASLTYLGIGVILAFGVRVGGAYKGFPADTVTLAAAVAGGIPALLSMHYFFLYIGLFDQSKNYLLRDRSFQYESSQSFG